MSNIQDVLSLVAKHRLTDILVGGYLDRERRSSYKTFNPLLDTIYLEFEDKLLKSSSINHGLQLEVADKVTPPDFFDAEEYDGEFCTGTVSDFFIGNAYSGGQIESFVAFLNADSDLDLGIVLGAELDLGQQGLLFLDPLNFFGVLVDTCAQHRDDWIQWQKQLYEKGDFPRSGLQRVKIDLCEPFQGNIRDIPREILF